MEIHERIQEIMPTVAAFRAKGILTPDEAKQCDNLLDEWTDLQKQSESAKRAGDLEKWSQSSAGLLPTAAPGTAMPLPDGGMQFNNARTGVAGTIRYTGDSAFNRGIDGNGRRFLELQEQFGEGVYDQSLFVKTRGVEYEQGFKAYLKESKGIRSVEQTSGYRALQEGIDAEGGVLVPAQILDVIIGKTPTPTRVNGMVTNLGTTSDTVVVPKNNYGTASDDTTGNLFTTPMRVIWTGEYPSSATAALVSDPGFGSLRIPIFDATMYLPLTLNMIEDPGFSLLSWVADKFAETVELEKDRVILNGNGINQGQGLFTNPGGAGQPTLITSATSGSVVLSDLQNVVMSLPEQYEDNSQWVFSKTQFGKYLAQMTDGDGRPLWSHGTQDYGMVNGYRNLPLLGFPANYSGFAPNFAAGNVVASFGDHTGYYLVTRLGLTVRVLTELGALQNLVYVVGRMRFGGAVVEPYRMELLRVKP
jgi:HK97 family phage major capsid protein